VPVASTASAAGYEIGDYRAVTLLHNDGAVFLLLRRRSRLRRNKIRTLTSKSMASPMLRAAPHGKQEEGHRCAAGTGVEDKGGMPTARIRGAEPAALNLDRVEVLEERVCENRFLEERESETVLFDRSCSATRWKGIFGIHENS
jgi:hypothetical protein